MAAETGITTEHGIGEGGAKAPPYIAYKTFRNFVDSLKKAMPSRIDRSVLHTMSGGAQSQMMHALRSMELVTQHGIPTDSLRTLVSAEGDERKGALLAALRVGYPFLFSGTIDLATATGKQLLEEFDKAPISGDTVRRSVAFFLAAAKDAGIPLSTYFDRIQARAGRGKRAAPNGAGAPNTEEHSKPKVIPYMTGEAEPDEQVIRKEVPSAAAQHSLLLWGLFQRLPEPGTVWAKAQREQWLQTLQNVFILEYKDE